MPQPFKPGKVPLERALSKLGIASRSQTRTWILSGRISVDGTIKRDPQFLVTPEKSRFELDGQALKASSWRTLLLYKPRGVVTTRSDEKGRGTIYSLLKDNDHHLHPVGRLDMATSGLLILTTDTQFSNWLTDPRNQVLRSYLVTVEGLVTSEELEKLKVGIKDQGELLKPEEIILRKASGKESHLTVKLTEGKNREIRRMFEVIGHDIISLKRITFGGLTLGSLQPAKYQEFSFEEARAAFPKAQFSHEKFPSSRKH